MNRNNTWQECGARLGVGRSTIFALWASGDLESVRVGSRRFSTDRQLDRYLQRLESGDNSPEVA